MDAKEGRKRVRIIFVIVTLAFLASFLIQRMGNDAAEGAIHILSREVEYGMKHTEQTEQDVHRIPTMHAVDAENREEKEARMRAFEEKEGR